MTSEIRDAAERLRKSRDTIRLYEVYDYEKFGHLASTTLAKRLDEVAVLNWAIEHLSQQPQKASEQ
jgi:hypothetical protein